jgi:hypothetical protein
VLQGHHKTTWKQVLHKHFPEPIDATVPVPAMQDRSLEENFHRAIIRSRKQDDFDGASNIVLPCKGNSKVI